MKELSKNEVEMVSGALSLCDFMQWLCLPRNKPYLPFDPPIRFIPEPPPDPT